MWVLVSASTHGIRLDKGRFDSHMSSRTRVYGFYAHRQSGKGVHVLHGRLPEPQCLSDTWGGLTNRQGAKRGLRVTFSKEV